MVHSQTKQITPDLNSEADIMMCELEKSPEFLPSLFWRDVNKKNIQMLETMGIDNFKRTLSQNYFNWLITSRSDPQYKNLIKKWFFRPSLNPFLLKIEKLVTLQFINREDEVVLTDKERLLYKIFVGLVWQTMKSNDALNLHKIIEEPEVGNPIQIRHILNKRLISQDLANSIIEYNHLIKTLDQGGARKKIAEIGAGYGRLAYVHAYSQNGTYFIFDIPPALQVSQWYLKETLKNKKIFTFRRFDNFEDIRAEAEASDIAFFTANQLTMFPENYFDVCASISTLPEMSTEQAHMFLKLFQKHSKKSIFLKQWKSWKNPLDNTDIKMDDYKLGKEWKIVLDKEDPINPNFFMRAWNKNI